MTRPEVDVLLPYTVVTDRDVLPRIAERIAATPDAIGIDYETTSLDPRLGEHRLAQFNIGGEIYVIDLFATGTFGPIPEALTESKAVKVIHNSRFEEKWSRFKHGFSMWPLFDTFRASQILDNGKKGLEHHLWAVEERYLGIDHTGLRDMGGAGWSGELTKQHLDYAALDVLHLPALREKMRSRIMREGLVDTATVEFGVVGTEAQIEIDGFAVDKDRWLDVANQNAEKAKVLRDKLLRSLPSPTAYTQTTMFGLAPNWNLDSPQQLLASLRKLGLKQRIQDPQTRKVRYVPLESTNELVLAQFAGEVPVIADLLEYRGYAQRVKSFGPKWLDCLHPITGRIHSEFWPFTEGGRYSNAKPNLQQIPREELYRRCFRPGPGKVLVVCDYSGVEMVILAELSGDRELQRVLRTDHPIKGDVHYNTASIVMAKDIMTVTKDERQKAKPVNFGYCLTKGTQVITRSGEKAIEDIVVGEEVLTHRGRWRKVERTFRRETDRLVKITTRNGRIVTCTPEHMWWVRFPSANGKPGGNGWVEAGDLRIGQYLVHHGYPYGSEDISWGVDIAKAVGWFLAEGSCDSNGIRIGQSEAVNPHVVAEMRRVLVGLLGFREYPDADNMRRFHLASAQVSDVFGHTGLELSARSESKRLPRAVFRLPYAERLALLAGLWEGDGTTVMSTEGKGVFTYESRSRGLLEDIRKLLDTCGMNASIYWYEKSDTRGSRGSVRVCGTRSMLRFASSVPSVKNLGESYAPGKVFACEEAITALEEEVAPGTEVFDLTVAEDHSFIANGLVTHNCYGMGATKFGMYALSNYGVRITDREAQLFRKRFFERYEGIARWHQRILRESQRSGFVRTIGGRIRYLPDDAYNERFNCLDAATEALTQRGWVRGFELRRDDILLTKNAETGQLEWQPMTDLKQWPDYEGPLVEFRSRTFNAVSTPNHRWLVRDKFSGRDVCRTTATISRHGDHRIHLNGNYEGPAETLTDDFVKVCGWFLTAGSWYPIRAWNNRPEATLYQSERANPDNTAEIDALLSRLGWDHDRRLNSRTRVVQWALRKEQSEALAALFPERVLTHEFLLRLSRRQARLLVETMLRGDGHTEASGKRTFTTRSKETAEAFQFLCVLAGWASRATKRDMRKYKPQSKHLINVPQAGFVWNVTIHSRNHAQVHGQHRREFWSRQGVWCPIVPNTFFVARREGVVFITGNTPSQGTGADALKRALRLASQRAAKYDGRVKVVHHVHDEIVTELDEDPELIEAWKLELQGAMIEGLTPYIKTVPVKADPAHGEDWAAAK